MQKLLLVQVSEEQILKESWDRYYKVHAIYISYLKAGSLYNTSLLTCQKNIIILFYLPIYTAQQRVLSAKLAACTCMILNALYKQF